MAERKVKVPVGDKMLDGVDVPVEETTERWTDIKLEDGTHLRVKSVISSVVRVDDMTDPEGNPVYVVKSMNVLSVERVGEKVKRKAN